MTFVNKHQQHDFQNGFQTHDSILDIVPYEPEVIFIGTFNHGWSWNDSDFYYGRGMYMWTVLGNLFLHNRNYLVSPRTKNNLQPTLPQLFEICTKGKIVFANIVKGLKEGISYIENPQEKSLLVNNNFNWCSREFNGNKIGQYSDHHIENLAKDGWLNDNVDAIVKFVNETPSLKHIYFTFKSGFWLVDRLNTICNQVRTNVSYCSIFSPTAKGFGVLLDPPFNNRAWGLAHCWVWNGLDTKHFINRLGYGHLNHDWLIDKGVKIELF